MISQNILQLNLLLTHDKCRPWDEKGDVTLRVHVLIKVSLTRLGRKHNALRCFALLMN